MRIQEATLTLRGQRGRCRNIKGEPQIYGSFRNLGHVHFSSGCGFMGGLGKSKLCTKFEVPSFSHCVNIEVNHKIFGSPLSPGPRPPFDFMMGLGKPQLRAKFLVASPSRCRYIIEEPPKFWGAPLTHVHLYFFLWV